MEYSLYVYPVIYTICVLNVSQKTHSIPIDYYLVFITLILRNLFNSLSFDGKREYKIHRVRSEVAGTMRAEGCISETFLCS